MVLVNSRITILVASVLSRLQPDCAVNREMRVTETKNENLP